MVELSENVLQEIRVRHTEKGESWRLLAAERGLTPQSLYRRLGGPPRRAALRQLIEWHGFTYAAAARRLSARFHRHVTERACRDVGQGMHLRASTLRGDARGKGQK